MTNTMTKVVSVVLFGVFCFYGIRSLQVIPERANVASYNPKYVDFDKFYVKRYSRRGNYYMNIEGTTKQVWNNNVSVHLVFYEYLHNEYKRSFVEMHFRLCDMLNKDPYLGRALANSGMPCPLPQGHIKIPNVTIPAAEFPNVWPFERCKVDAKLQITTSGEPVANLEAYLYFKNKEQLKKDTKKSTKNVR